MRIRLLLLTLLLIFAFTLFSQQSSTPRKAKSPAAADNSDTPAKPDAVEKAKKLYSYDCAMCHGENGDGKGDMSADYAGKLKDFTDPAALRDVTDDQLLQVIKDGKGDMPPEGKRAKADELRELVRYVRSFAKK